MAILTRLTHHFSEDGVSQEALVAQVCVSAVYDCCGVQIEPTGSQSDKWLGYQVPTFHGAWQPKEKLHAVTPLPPRSLPREKTKALSLVFRFAVMRGPP